MSAVEELRAELDVLIEKRASALAERDQADADAAAARNRSSEIADLETRVHLAEISAEHAAELRKDLVAAIEQAEAEAERWAGVVEGIDRRVLDQADTIAAEYERTADVPRQEAAQALAAAQAALAAAQRRYEAAEAIFQSAREDGAELVEDAREAVGLVDREQRTRARAFINAAVRAARGGAPREVALYQGGLRGQIRTRRDQQQLEKELAAAYAARAERLGSSEAVSR
jgi:hypothetical protein